MWLGPSKVRLTVSIAGKRRTRVVRVKHRDHGGRGEAQDALQAFERELRTPRRPKAPTVAELFAEYIHHSDRVGRARGTLEAYRVIEKRLGAFGKLRCDQVTTRDVDEFYGSLGLAPSTIRMQHGILLASFRQGIRWGLFTGNPLEGATLPKDRRVAPKPLTAVEVGRMIRATEDPVVQVGLFLAAWTGCRRGEVVGLRWEDIGPGSIRVERQWVPAKGGQYLTVPKSAGGVRDVPVDEYAMAFLDLYRTAMTDLFGYEPDGWLLSYDGGHNPLRAKSFGEKVADLARTAGVKGTLHSFRKFTTTQLIAGGVDVDTAARRMGHSKQVMMGVYSLGSGDAMADSARVLSERLVAQGLDPLDYWSR
jgi:integrase